jgi:hypothetical protein
MRLNGLEDLCEQGRPRRLDQNSRPGGFVSGHTDADIAEVKCPAHHENRIQDLGEDERINDVAFEKDGFLRRDDTFLVACYFHRGLIVTCT